MATRSVVRDTWRDEVCRAYQQPLVRYLRSVGATSHEAEDIAQDALERFLTAAGSLDRDQPILPWLVTVATRIRIDRARGGAARTDPVGLEIEGAPTSAATPESWIERLDERRKIAAALDPLTDPQRRVLIHRFVHERDIDQIATLEDLTPAASWSLLARARAAFGSTYDRIDRYSIAATSWITARLARLRGRHHITGAPAAAPAGLVDAVHSVVLPAIAVAIAASTFMPRGDAPTPERAVATPVAIDVPALPVTSHQAENLTATGGTVSPVKAAAPGPASPEQPISARTNPKLHNDGSRRVVTGDTTVWTGDDQVRDSNELGIHCTGTTGTTACTTLDLLPAT